MTNRRQFLASLSGALVATVVPAAETERRNRGLGYGLYGMKTVPLDAALGHCAEIGYRHVEFALYPGYGVSPDELSAGRRAEIRRRLGSLRLGLSAMKLRLGPESDPAGAAANVRSLAAAAALARDVAPDDPPALVLMTDGKTGEWERLKETLVGGLQRWADAVAPFGVVLAVKAHVGNAVDTPEKLLWLLRRANRPALRAVYDYSHFELAGLTLEASLRQVAPLMTLVHVKDVRRTPGGHEFVLPGDGGTDFGRYAALLREVGFAGPIVVEVSTHVFSQPGYDPLAAARRAYRALAVMV
jgi:sugar phosphate isomerase/epimerase